MIENHYKQLQILRNVLIRNIVTSLDAWRESADTADWYYWSVAENFQWRLDIPLAMEGTVWRKDDIARQREIGEEALWEALWRW